MLRLLRVLLLRRAHLVLLVPLQHGRATVLLAMSRPLALLVGLCLLMHMLLLLREPRRLLFDILPQGKEATWAPQGPRLANPGKHYGRDAGRRAHRGSGDLRPRIGVLRSVRTDDAVGAAGGTTPVPGTCDASAFGMIVGGKSEKYAHNADECSGSCSRVGQGAS